MLVLTWTGLDGPHAVDQALLADLADADAVAQSADDFLVAKGHGVDHLLDLRLQSGQHLLQTPGRWKRSGTQQSSAPLTHKYFHILHVETEQSAIFLTISDDKL